MASQERAHSAADFKAGVFAPQTWEKVVFFMDFDFIHA